MELRNKKFLQAVTKFKVIRGELSGCSEDIKVMGLLLLSYFAQKEDVMFCYVEDICLAGEVQMDQVQLNPTIVACEEAESRDNDEIPGKRRESTRLDRRCGGERPAAQDVNRRSECTDNLSNITRVTPPVSVPIPQTTQYEPIPGVRDAARPDPPGPLPGMRDAARPDLVPVPVVRDAARPDPFPVPVVRDAVVQK
ncbi:hypothetical protein P4O66_007996 [Electrophorus voltai]|uniref:Uncharacterized protein n=1 Tax=Electrophorus voltai TaxID=2609070 RepID=A0AAD8ZH67_9TELE|nr:hypothetical protein P4O66_007996 [Electrophorus voltai]